MRRMLVFALTTAALTLALPSAGMAQKKKPKKRYPTTFVTTTLLPGSVTKVEIPALALPGGQTLVGTPATREIPMSGQLRGVIAHRFRYGQNIDINYTSAAFRLGAIDLLSDPACGGAPVLRLNPSSGVVIDKSQRSTAVLKYSGVSTATASVLLRLAFDMRTEPRCDAPLVTSGIAETPFTDRLRGTVGPRGLLGLELDGAPTDLPGGICLYPGAPDKACAGVTSRYPVKVTVHVIVSISLKSGK